jgi:hypothetical protein
VTGSTAGAECKGHSPGAACRPNRGGACRAAAGFENVFRNLRLSLLWPAPVEA